MTIEINIEFVGALRKLAGKDAVSLEFDSFIFVKDVIFKLANLFSKEFRQALVDPELNDPRPNVLILLNGTEISALEGLETRVENNDKLVLIPVSHGG